MNSNRVYEDENGIRYRCVGFSGGQYKMKIVNSPYTEVHEGLIDWMDELPSKVVPKKELD